MVDHIAHYTGKTLNFLQKKYREHPHLYTFIALITFGTLGYYGEKHDNKN